MTELFQHKARKRFGQNFLQDAGVIDAILHAVYPKANEYLLEIGPGQGAITQGLLGSGAHLDVIELDKDLIPLLKLRFGLNPAFQLHQGDALKFDLASLCHDAQKLRVVGNLPYNISTPLIFRLLEQKEVIADMHFMLQKEVVERLAAVPGNGDWGRLSIMVQYACHVEHLFDVPPESFTPAPKVDSAIVRLVPYEQLPYPAKSYQAFEYLVREAFSQRRKTLRNTLKRLLTADEIESIGIDSALRAEQLALADFVKLADIFASK